MQVRWFAFGRGLNQTVDDRVREPAIPRAAENLRLDRLGRLLPRLDYDAVPRDIKGSIFDSVVFDLHAMAGTDIVALAGDSSASVPNPNDLLTLVEQPAFTWRRTDDNGDIRLCQVTDAAEVGAMPSQGDNVRTGDVAAGGGLVCAVWRGGLSTDTTALSVVHVFDPESDQTVHVQTLDLVEPRVVCVGSAFFVAGLDASPGTEIQLWRYDPATDDELVQLTDAFGAGANAGSWDMLANEDGDGFTIVLERSTPSTTIRLFDGDGAQVAEITTSIGAVTALAVLSQADRTHVAWIDAGAALTLSTYEHAGGGGTLENETSNPESVGTVARAPALGIGNTGGLVILVDDATPAGVAIMYRNPATHGVISALKRWEGVTLNSKPLGFVSMGTEIFAGLYDEGDFPVNPGQLSNFLGLAGASKSRLPGRIEVYLDKALAMQVPSGHLPAIGFDATTGRAYWIRFSIDEDGRGQPVVAGFTPGGTDRRQSAELAGWLFFAGGMMQAFDRRQLLDVAFPEKPRIISVAASNGSGSLTADGVYQIVAVWERYAGGRLWRSAPSEVFESTLSGAEDTLTVTVSTPHGEPRAPTNDSYEGAVKLVIYSTSDLNGNGGDFTLHRHAAKTIGVEFGAPEEIDLTRDDETIEVGAVIYTQRARGVITGSFPWDSPRPCTALDVSGDAITSVGLPERSLLQESMPLFPREPVTWSDAIGFERDGSEPLLAVKRIESRRAVWTSRSILLFSGPGLDSNGSGDIGPPEPLTTDYGLHGGRLGWRSMVEWKGGIAFQATASLLCTLPPGLGTPEPFGERVQDLLATYPVITSATRDRAGETLRFTCNNAGNTDGIVLVYDSTADEWFSEGPFGQPIAAGAMHGDRFCMVRQGIVYRQRTSGPPAAFIDNAWRSSFVREGGHGGWMTLGKVFFYGVMRGNCTITPVVTFSDESVETLTAKTLQTSGTETADNLIRALGREVAIEWTPNRTQCENFRVDFEVSDLSGAATDGLEYTSWGYEATEHGKGAMRDVVEIG
jgi:hypothetical protein